MPLYLRSHPPGWQRLAHRINTKTGAGIPIEQRNPFEVTSIHGRHPVVPAGVAVYNPAFDVTLAELITGIITERGVFKPGELLTPATTRQERVPQESIAVFSRP